MERRYQDGRDQDQLGSIYRCGWINPVGLWSYSRYGPPDRSATQRRPLSRGSNPCSYPREPLVSYRINRQLSGWNLPPLMIRAFGAHCQKLTYATYLA